MATSFGTALPTIVVYRVHRVDPFARVRVHIGEQPSGNCVGELALRPSEYRLWRATLRAHDPSRFTVWYGDGVFEWLASLAPQMPEVADAGRS